MDYANLGATGLRVSELQAEIGALTDQAKALRDELHGLMPTLTERRWPVVWPAEAAALLHDPEADLQGASEGVPNTWILRCTAERDSNVGSDAQSQLRPAPYDAGPAISARRAYGLEDPGG